MRNVLISTLSFGLLLIASTALSQDLTNADEIVNRANIVAYYGGDDGRSQVRLTITDGSGAERTRVLSIIRRDRAESGDQDFLVVISRPSDLRGTVFLVAKHPDADDDRWLYLPDLDLVRRIAAGDKRTSFIGSHFFYEDVSGRSTAEDTHRLVETTDEHYVIENTPVDASSVEFASYQVWIDKTTFMPMTIEYTDDSGEPYRRVEVLDIETVGGYPTVVRSRISDLRTGGSTVADFANVEYDLGVPEDIFNERSLRNPPAQWVGGR